MNKTKYILLCAAAILAACKNESEPTFSIGADDNAIVLAAGISEGDGGVVTRAYNPEANHSSHLKFTQGTALTLRVDGVWKEKADGTAPHGTITSTLVSQKTTATIGDDIVVNSEGSATHNKVTFTPAQQLYWDDYGSADPANMSTEKGGTVGDGTDGRGRGLDIFAVAVDGVETAPEVSSWTALPWNVGTPSGDPDTINQTGGWSAKDLLTSNNVKKTDDVNTTNPYKFDDRASGKLLEFTHAMTKVTVNLTAGEGFPGYATDPANATFVQAPTVTLLGFNYTGTVSVETKTSTPTADTKTNIKAHLASGGAGQHTASFEALVFPGNTITNVTTDYILELNADGNVLKVSGAKLYEKMTSLSHGYILKDGVNYVLNIKVNMTGIVVDATIKDWVDVAAANEAPVINISDAYGHDGTGFNRNFDLYRSTAVNGSYLTGITEGNHTVVNYVAEAGSDPVIPAHYELAAQMYWPNHSTHYFFRGIWPLVDSKDSSPEPQQLGPTPAQVKANSIEVANVAYKQGYYPSDLMIGIPRKNDGSYDETCKVAGHDKSAGANGICATEGKIRINFQYAMSQVLVELKTSTGADKVIFDAETKVEIIGGYTQGEIKLSDESSDFTGKTVTDYFMHNIANDDYDSYRDAIIPQSLVDGSGNATLKFRITVKSGETYDKYETVLGIKDIQVQENGGTKKSITAWEPGKKYTYTLQITKSGVKVTATLKDWIEVKASEDVWF